MSIKIGQKTAEKDILDKKEESELVYVNCVCANGN